MPKCEKLDWQDLLVVYGWEDDMTEEYLVVVPGPITEEMTQDEEALPWAVMRGNRTYVYKSQRIYATYRTAARETLESWCGEAGITVEEMIDYLLDPEKLGLCFSNSFGPDMMDDWAIDYLAGLVETITGKRISDDRLEAKSDPHIYTCSC